LSILQSEKVLKKLKETLKKYTRNPIHTMQTRRHGGVQNLGHHRLRMDMCCHGQTLTTALPIAAIVKIN